MTVQRIEDIPVGEHWAIIEVTTFTVPGDQRSRDAPGHGYPAHTEQQITYRAYTDEAAFLTEMKSLLTGQYTKHRNVRGIHVQGTYAPITTVQLEEKQ